MPPRKTITGLSNEPRRRFAEQVRILRRQSGETLGQLAERLGWDKSTLSRVERGESLGSPEIVEALDHHYSSAPLLLSLWELAVPTQFREEYQRFMQLESEARAIHLYAPVLVPGLFQTESYAQTVMKLDEGEKIAPEALAQQVEARMSRQELLTREDAPHVRAILDEAIFHRTLPRPEWWREQLGSLLDVMELPNVTIQVLPFSAGIRELNATDLHLLREVSGNTVAWVENTHGGELVEKSASVEYLQRMYDRLRDHCLMPAASAQFIHDLLEGVHVPPS